jgi:hypothetical protein
MIQRRPAAKRLFTGLAGRPFDPGDTAPTPVVAPEPVVSVTPIAPKRGRPPTNGGEAMSAAERQRQSRARKRQAETAPERLTLLKLIVRRVKTSEHADIEMMKRALKTFHDALDALTVEDLRDIAKQYTVLHDRKGRSSLEGHTGTKLLVAGEFIDRIERIFAKSESQMMYGGRKPAMGASPNVDDQSDEDSGITSSNAPTRESEVTVWDLIPQVTEYLFEGDEENMWDTEESTLTNLPTLRCRACQHQCSTWTEARRHIEEMVKDGEKQGQMIRTLEEAADKDPATYESLLVDARIRYRDVYWPHHAVARNFVTKRKDG